MVTSFARTNDFKSDDPKSDAWKKLDDSKKTEALESDAARQKELLEWFPYTPAVFWTRTCVDHNGFFGIHTSSETALTSSKIANPSAEPSPASSSKKQTETSSPGGSAAGHQDTISTFFRLIVKILKSPDARYQVPASNTSSDKSYIWHEMGFMSFSSDSRSTVICFNVPEDVIEGLQVTLSASAGQHGGPLGLHLPLLEEMVKLYDHSVWLMANNVREIEQVSRGEHAGIIEPDDRLAIITGIVSQLTGGNIATSRRRLCQTLRKLAPYCS